MRTPGCVFGWWIPAGPYRLPSATRPRRRRPVLATGPATRQNAAGSAGGSGKHARADPSRPRRSDVRVCRNPGPSPQTEPTPTATSGGDVSSPGGILIRACNVDTSRRQERVSGGIPCFDARQSSTGRARPMHGTSHNSRGWSPRATPVARIEDLDEPVVRRGCGRAAPATGDFALADYHLITFAATAARPRMLQNASGATRRPGRYGCRGPVGGRLV